MTESGHEHDILASALAKVDNGEIFSPGIFNDSKALLMKNGYDAAGIYLLDDYPDAMRLVSRYGYEAQTFPELVPVANPGKLDFELLERIGSRPGLTVHPLFASGRHVGAVALIRLESSGASSKALQSIIGVISMLAYIEIVRANCRRERLEREIFFGQSLSNRLLRRRIPESKHFRLGYELWRSLEVGGDFFDFVPVNDGRIYAFIGRCSGKGLKTVLEMVEIMHQIDRCFVGMESMADIARQVNEHLIRNKKRSNLASLCLLEVDPVKKTVRIIKAGSFALAILRPDSIQTISINHSLFLGMIGDLELREEVYEFNPGSAVFCATEGINTIRDVLDQALPATLITDTVADSLRNKPLKALINEAFERIKVMCDYSPVHDSIAAISIEFLET
ncbi:MAG: SpoIIE family protein phosphatase [Planctomycetota bacterium]|jgi:serine phosphatase RsbU (regulator of sigma subunit)|nr:SpoIIE family protein phosphatase [Planctomycetota bacterium]